MDEDDELSSKQLTLSLQIMFLRRRFVVYEDLFGGFIVTVDSDVEEKELETIAYFLDSYHSELVYKLEVAPF